MAAAESTEWAGARSESTLPFHLPIVPHDQPRPDPTMLGRAEALAARILREHPELRLDDDERRLRPVPGEVAPALHLEDQSAIAAPPVAWDTTYVQDRARLRAGDGDLVVTSAPPSPGYERYCTELLQLGAPLWLHPGAGRSTRGVAALCWRDLEIRHAILRVLRSAGCLHVHPLMGSAEVWQLAALLGGAARLPVRVIAPPPRLARWVNDKVAFMSTVSELFGEELIPASHAVSNFALLSHQIRELAQGSRAIGVKVPFGAGGTGNAVLEARWFRGKSLRTIRRKLMRLLTDIGWRGSSELLVTRWETDVLCAPSAQLWIPAGPEAPVFEGLFEQTIEGSSGAFVGVRPAELPRAQALEIAERSTALAHLFQKLGYVGRCSFDVILAGADLESSRLEFIECNGRWGGTSLPMTLMNRLFGNWASVPFVVHCSYRRGLERIAFEDLLDHFGGDLFDARTGEGRLIFFTPARMAARSGIDAIALGHTPADATRLLRKVFPRWLRAFVRTSVRRTARGSPAGPRPPAGRAGPGSPPTARARSAPTR